MTGREFWQGVFHVQSEKTTPWLGLRNAIGVALPLIAFAAWGDLSAGLLAAVGALDVSFSDSHGPFLQRRRRMLAASFLVGAAVSAGAIGAHNDQAALLLVTLGAFVAGLLVALSTDAADLGVISLVTMIVFAASPLAWDKAIYSGFLTLAGGLLQTGLALATWPLRRFDPERRILGHLYLELSEVAVVPTEVRKAPPASYASNDAQTSLATLDQDRSVEAERYRLLLHHGEQIRLVLLLVIRLRNRVQRESASDREVKILDGYLSTVSHTLAALGSSLIANESAGLAGTQQELQVLVGTISESRSITAFGDAGMTGHAMEDALGQLAALFRRMSTVLDLAQSCTSIGSDSFARREALTPWKLRLSGTLATLRASLSLDSAAFRHAIRLAVCVGLGELLSRSLQLQRAYWMPMTIVLVLKPDFSSTFTRGVLRLGGTFTGLLLATVLFHWIPSTLPTEISLVIAFVFILRCWGSTNYGIFTFAITALVVVLNGLAGISPADVAGPRAMNTAAGGIVALLAYALWPTWERTQVASAVAAMLNTYREYIGAIRAAYQQPDRSFTRELDRIRLAARRARINLEASIDRLATEPSSSTEALHALRVAMASSHRFAHAALAVEAMLATHREGGEQHEFSSFLAKAELVLYFLAGTLRGSEFDSGCLTDLTNAEKAYINAANPGDEHLLITEADRITSSLNTLSDEVLTWIDLNAQRGRRVLALR